jgi:hypothetical protein
LLDFCLAEESVSTHPNLDEGTMWPTAFALQALTLADEASSHADFDVSHEAATN